jgi:tRNA-Thr(GGU) m(6)t(6)A37 methyltransferase TsaA
MAECKQFTLDAIGIIRSCYKEKFGIPRQPALVSSPASIEMEAAYSQDEAFRELESFSHIWVVFIFNGVANQSWHPTVRPPRLGGNKRVGVFASRSMFRPNPIGLSVVELKSIERKDNKIILNIIGGDFLDLTPVLDIKPYIPYSDSISTANAGYANDAPEISLNVVYSDKATQQIKNHTHAYPKLEKLITEILQQDPRPAYQKNKLNKNEFGMKLYEFDLQWTVEDNNVYVTSLSVQG